jgi:AcrR family transcriptional regulator
MTSRTAEPGDSSQRPISLRDQQRQVTDDRIIQALAELIETQHPLDVTMSAVARQAGVSEPTLYRHFPTKRELFAALGSSLYRQTTTGVAPTSLDELVAVLPTLYQRFAAMEAIVRWNLAAPKGEVVRPPAAERLPILRDALGDELDGLPPADAEHLLRGVLLMTAPTSMLYWQDYLGITVDEAAATASWLLRRIAGS